MSETTVSNTVSSWQPYAPPGRRGQMPWSGGKIWFWILLALLAVILTTIAWGVPYIESRLDRLSRARLLSAGVDASTLNLRWDYRNLTVNGELPANVDVEQLTDILRQGIVNDSNFLASGIRRLKIDVKPPPVEENMFLTEAEQPSLSVAVRIENNNAVLDGVVQTQQQREALLNAMLESGTASIADNLEVMDINIASSGSDTKVEALARMLAEAGPGQAISVVASLDEDNLNYRVKAIDLISVDAIKEAADIVMIGFQVNGQITTDGAAATAVDVSAIVDEGTLTLTGQIFSEEQHRRLFFAANEAMGDASQVVDQLQVIEQQALLVGTDERIDELASILSRLTPMVSGEVQMRGVQLSIDAIVDTEQVKANLQEITASARGSGLSIDENISVFNDAEVDSVSEFQQGLDQLVWQVRENVTFNSGNATLNEEALATLKLVADVINAYPQLNVEVEGHTDNVGRDSVNEALSRKRALAVKNYLISQSVADSRLVAVGYGQRVPIDSNDTPEGRKRNRRVHFNVVKQQLTN